MFIAQRWAGMRKRRAESEAAYFRRFRETCMANDARGAMRRLIRWLDQFGNGHRTATLGSFMDQVGNPDLAARVTELNLLLFARREEMEKTGAEVTWSGKRLYKEVAKCRKILILKKKHRASARRTLSLNPTIAVIVHPQKN